MPTPARRSARRVVLAEGIVLVPAPTFSGTVRRVPTPARARRGRVAVSRATDARRPPSLDSAVAENDARVVSTFAIRASGPGSPGRRRGAKPQRPSRAPSRVGDLELETADDEAVVVLREHPDGTTTWLFPQPVPLKRRMRGLGAPRSGAARVRRWTCPISSPPAPTSQPKGTRRRPRGLLGRIGGAIIKVILFKVAGWAAEKLLHHLVERHERRRMIEGFKRVAAGGFFDPKSPAMKPSDWTAISGQPALVFVHGTFSDSLGAFRRLDRPTIEALRARYPGGVYAFDHFSLTKSPLENAQMFLASLPDQADLRIDLVTHSRGGLVARSLTELAPHPNVTFGNVVFFGTPNAGTALADPERLKSCMNLLTNLVNLIPDFAGLFVLSWIVAVVQWVAANGVGKLPGLVPQSPSSEFLKSLNDPVTASNARYAAISADYEADTGLLAKLKDAGMDALFAAPNDLVVPTASVTSVDVAAAQPVFVAGRTLSFQGSRVFHGNFFEQPAARAFLLSVLS